MASDFVFWPIWIKTIIFYINIILKHKFKINILQYILIFALNTLYLIHCRLIMVHLTLVSGGVEIFLQAKKCYSNNVVLLKAFYTKQNNNNNNSLMLPL